MIKKQPQFSWSQEDIQKYEDGKVKTNGGRVIAITSIGNSVEEALEKSYKSIRKINFEKMNYRKDIGFDL